MEGQKRIGPARIFFMVVFDIALLAIFMAAFLPAHLTILAGIYLPIVVVLDVVFLRRCRARANVPAATGNGIRTGTFSLYMCSVIFFIGTLYGLLTIIQGQLPRLLLPLLLVPLSMALYCWKMARRVAAQKSEPSNTGLNHSTDR